MTNTEIETSYRGILSLLEEKRLKEAFCKTAELAALLPDEWQSQTNCRNWSRHIGI